jgi:4-hydroxy-3-methylbut-2-enyl diphosphate reductase
MMLVIGGRNSSNTQKLFAVCRERCRSYLIENAAELSEISFNGVSSIGVTAGASTPDSIIKEVVKTMSEIIETIGTAPEAEGQAEVAVNPEEMSFAELVEEDFNTRQTTGKKAVGIVTRVSANEIEVDIGRKQTGYIPIDEYSSDPAADPTKELNVGDEINVIIMKTNDAEGTVLLSKRLYDISQHWDAIVEARKEGTVLEGTVGEVIGKGLIIYLNGIRIFIPASLSTVPRDGRLEDMLNKEVKFKIIDTDNRGHKAVGSIRDAYREARREAKEKFWAEAAEGQQYTGTVKSLTDYGAFVELAPGVDGMIHRSELSWKRIKHPSEVVNVGDTVDVYIKGLDTEKKKISLGYKKIEDNPWEILKRDYPVGSEITVRIVRMTTFGAFAEIFPKMEGLIHISQIANERIEKPQDVLSIGDEVKVKVTDIDFDKKRISLSIKALLPPPERKREERRAPVDNGPAVYSIDDLLAKANAAEAAAAAAEEAPAAVTEAAAEVAEIVEEAPAAVEEAAAEVAEAVEEAPAAVEEAAEAVAEAVEEAPAAVEEAAEAAAEAVAEEITE